MQADYAAVYRSLHERHWWWRTRARHVLDWIEELRPAEGFGPILDVGCGEALWFETLARFGSPEGVESDPALAEAGARRGARIWAQPFDRSFLPGRAYGLILMLDVLEHMEDDRAALAHAASLLRPGGALVATAPAFQWLWTRHDELNCHVRRYRAPELQERASAAGLEVIRGGYFFHWMILPKLAVRLRERLSPGAAASLPKVPPKPINAALEALGAFEKAALARLRIPFGGSAYLLARLRARP